MAKPNAMPDLHALHVAAVVIEMGGMSPAAARLGVTQSAVSQAVRRAEAQVGVALVDRNQRPLRPTEAGQRLALHMSEIGARVDQAVADLRRHGGRPERRDLRLGMVDSFAAAVGPLLIRDLMLGALAARVTAQSGLAPSHADSLAQHQIDAAITSDALRGDDLSQQPFYREPFLLVAPRAQMARIEAASLAEVLRAHPLIRYSARSHMGRQVESHLRRLGLEPAHRLSFDTSDALLAMVAGGVGVAITTALCLRQASSHLPDLAVLPLPGPAVSRTLAVVTRRADAEAVGSRIAEAARRILQGMILPQLTRDLPGLASLMPRVLLPDPTEVRAD